MAYKLTITLANDEGDEDSMTIGGIPSLAELHDCDFNPAVRGFIAQFNAVHGVGEDLPERGTEGEG